MRPRCACLSSRPPGPPDCPVRASDRPTCLPACLRAGRRTDAPDVLSADTLDTLPVGSLMMPWANNSELFVKSWFC